MAPSTSLVDVMAEPGHVALRGATSSSFSLCVDRMVSITSSVGSLKSWRKSSFQAVRDGDFVEFYAILCILNSYFAWDALRVYMEWHRDFIRRSEMHDLRLALGPSPCGFFATSPRHHSSSILPRSLIPCWSGSQIASNELIEQLASAKDKQKPSVRRSSSQPLASFHCLYWWQVASVNASGALLDISYQATFTYSLVLRAQIEKEARKMRRLDTIGRVAKGLCDLQTALRKTRRRWILFMVSVWFQDVSRLRQAATDLESPTLTFSL